MGSEEPQHLWETLKDQGIADDNIPHKSARKKTNGRISCFLQGLINIIADLLCGKGISLNNLFPQLSFAINTS